MPTNPPASARDNKNPFVREGHADKPGIIGSHWWNQELADASKLKSRRQTIVALVAGAGVVAAAYAAIVLGQDDTYEQTRRSLDLQRDFGWSFGATSETVAFDALYTTTYAREALARLVAELTPRNGALQPWFMPTLFQAPEALPRLPLSSPDSPAPTVLAAALRPIHTPSMILAEAAGAALADLLAAAGNGVALVVDLDGPDSVALAAGLADRFEPVFLFDNWPHPKGVVPAHLTLAAAVYHQPRFAQAASARSPNAPPVFVLDRKRLAPYSDEAEQFDNRWLAKIPAPEDLVKLEIKRVLYVVPSQTAPIELRDVSGHLAGWARSGAEVRAIALDAFGPAEDGKVRFGGSVAAHEGFFGHYPWRSPAPPPVPVPKNDQAAAWRPREIPQDPSDLRVGFTVVDVDRDTGAIVGPHAFRSGSYNRSSGGWGG